MKVGDYVKLSEEYLFNDCWWKIRDINDSSILVFLEEKNTCMNTGLENITALKLKDEFEQINDVNISQKTCDELTKLLDKMHSDSFMNCKPSKAVIDKIESATEKINSFGEITSQMRDTYIAKNADYGNSFDKSMDEFGLTASVVRMSDKMERLKSLTKKKAQVKDESISDTLMDLATYCVMTVMHLNKEKDENKDNNK
jgi:hypothetical protein